jgi:hypothetical protein
MIMGSIEEEDFFSNQSNHTNYDFEPSYSSERPDEDETLSISASSIKKEKSGNTNLIVQPDSDSCGTNN